MKGVYEHDRKCADSDHFTHPENLYLSADGDDFIIQSRCVSWPWPKLPAYVPNTCTIIFPRSGPNGIKMHSTVLSLIWSQLDDVGYSLLSNSYLSKTSLHFFFLISVGLYFGCVRPLFFFRLVIINVNTETKGIYHTPNDLILSGICTHICLTYRERDIGKRNRPKSDGYGV